MSTRTIENHAITLVNERKILFPKSRITKQDLLLYYQRIAPYLLPLIHNHPIALNRFPDGINHEGFYQKNIGSYFPKWIGRIAIKHRGDTQSTTYALCNDLATLIYLANQATITIHTWLSCVGKLHFPDRMIFDLDPAKVPRDWQLVVDTAQEIKKALEGYELESFIMTTGAHGVHVVVPLAQQQSFSVVKKFARSLAHQLCTKHPQHLTLDMRKQQRGNKLFIDTLRNQWAQLAVAPYSVRAREGAPVATPLAWHELSDPAMHSQRYTIENIFRRLGHANNPWHHFYDSMRMLPD